MYEILNKKLNNNKTVQQKETPETSFRSAGRIKAEINNHSRIPFSNSSVLCSLGRPLQLRTPAFGQNGQKLLSPEQKPGQNYYQNQKISARMKVQPENTPMVSAKETAPSSNVSNTANVTKEACIPIRTFSGSHYSAIQRMPGEEDSPPLPDDYQTIAVNVREFLDTELEPENLAKSISDYEYTLELYTDYGNIWYDDLLEKYNSLKKEYHLLFQLRNTHTKYLETRSIHENLYEKIRSGFQMFHYNSYLMSYRIYNNVSSILDPFLNKLQTAKQNCGWKNKWFQRIEKKLKFQKNFVALRNKPDNYENEHSALRERMSRQIQQDQASIQTLHREQTPVLKETVNQAAGKLKTMLDTTISNGELDIEPLESQEFADHMIRTQKLTCKAAEEKIEASKGIESSFPASDWINGILPVRGNAYGKSCASLQKDARSSVPVHNTLYLDSVPVISVKKPGINDDDLAASVQELLLGSGITAFHITPEVHGPISAENPHAYRKGPVLTKWRTTESLVSPLSENEFCNKMTQICTQEVTNIEALLKARSNKKRNRYRSQVRNTFYSR